MYPALMIEYNLLSRNVKDSTKYREIRDKRIELKKLKDKMQLPLKIVLNSTYGAMKDKFNELYDPLMANNVCVYGQLFLLDLIEKIEPFGELVQSNTDGILVKVHDRHGYLNACNEWSKRTRLDLEHDDYKKIIQKDVNNYIIVEPSGKYKSKGAYVKKLSAIDYDLPILNDALIEYFVHGTSIETTINNCNELIKFQQVVKISRIYKYALHGNKPIKERVSRIFASKLDSDEGIFKLKEGNEQWIPTYDETGNIINEQEDKREKVPKTPEKAFIFNDSVIGLSVPDKLDKQHYINMANGRLSDFIDGKLKSTEKSDVKGVILDMKNKIVEQINLSNDDSFYDFLLNLHKTVNPKKGQIEPMIRLDYLKRFGNSKYLESYYNLFKLFWDSKLQDIKPEITSASADKVGIKQDLLNSFGTKAKTKYINLSVKNIIEYTLSSDLNYSEVEKINWNCKYKEVFDYHNGIKEYKMIVYTKKIQIGEISYGVFHSIGSGNSAKLFIPKYIAEKLTEGDIIKIDHMKQIPKQIYNYELKRMLESDTEYEWYMDRYSIPEEFIQIKESDDRQN